MFTANQVRYLRRGLNGWATVRGACLIGKSNGRGLEFVLRSLEKAGLIERRYLNTTHDRPRVSQGYDDIRTTVKGRAALDETEQLIAWLNGS